MSARLWTQGLGRESNHSRDGSGAIRPAGSRVAIGEAPDHDSGTACARGGAHDQRRQQHRTRAESAEPDHGPEDRLRAKGERRGVVRRVHV